MQAEIVIKFEQVGINFGEHWVHQDINFSLNKGQSTTILGPSGSGKTLLLKMIVGLLQPTRGTVRVLGQDLGDLSETELRNIRKHIGMLFQGAALFDSLTVFENIAYPLREYHSASEAEIPDIVAEKLAVVGLSGTEQKLPAQLSGGQKKRVGLARALASSPEILLFDEPTTGLDPTSTRLIDDLIIRLGDEFGITCLSVTHDIASARRISDRWILIDRGTVQADGPVATISEQDQQIIDFISGNWKNEMNFSNNTQSTNNTGAK